jgi:glycosyltransferase involved in cell wall biosynthesis
MKDLSIVIPLLNEAESLPELHAWLTRVLSDLGRDYEILFIDDGSNDSSWEVIKRLQNEDSHIRGIRFLRNYGKSQALHAGFKAADGKVVITMDADLQDSPDEIPELYRMIQEEGYDLVSGWKKKRYDSKIKKNLPSKLFNWAARKASGLPLHDFNCGLKAYDNKVIKNINVHGEMHRYIPVLAKNAGFENITEKVVKHQARKYGVTKFGISRFINGFLDLITLWFVDKFGKRPMHLFGLIGTFMFIIGFLAAFGIGLNKLLHVYYYHTPAKLITDNPWFYLSLVTMVIGTQFFLAGFLGEIIIRNNPQIEPYQIMETL